MLSKNVIKVWNAGKIKYSYGLLLQNAIAARHHRPMNENVVNDTLLIVEHYPVYTIGLRTSDYSAQEIKQLEQTGAEFFKTNRGGLITFHGPGQLVVYPIINLKHYKPSMKWYVHSLEECIIQLCKKFYGLSAFTSPHTGVWINDRKVCAIGIHGSKYITTHGLALNCNTDLNWFNHIVPCGIKGKGVTSLTKELNQEVTIGNAAPLFVETFCNVFQCEPVTYSDHERKSITNELEQLQNV